MKTELTYKSILAANANLKQEYTSLAGAIKCLTGSETAQTDATVKRLLRMLADGKVPSSKDGRSAIIRSLKQACQCDDAGQILRKSTKKEQAAGQPELVAKTTFSAFWILQTAYRLSK